MKFIETFREGDTVSEVYLCKTKVVAKTKAGKTYYSVTLQDKTGTVDAKIWEVNNAIGHFEPLDYIKVDGQVTVFNDINQLNIKRVRKAEENEYVVSDYMPCSKKDVEAMYADLMSIINTIEEPGLAKLLNMYFVEDKEFIKKFKAHSAAKSIHHGFIGGLLEHTVSVAKLCYFLAMQYPALNKDLLVTAAIFHDLGKIDELSEFPANDYTDEGQLVGHIVMGAMMLKEKIKTIPNFSKKLENELIHCILAHHGELEYGSPKKPALIEAVALSHADNLDAKLQTFTEILDANKDNSDWFGFNRLFDSNIRHT